MRHLFLSASAALVLMTSCAMAQDASIPPTLTANTIYSTSSPSEITNAPNGDNTIVCNYQRETGSLFTTRVCRTLRAWKLMQADARDWMGYGERGTHQKDE